MRRPRWSKTIVRGASTSAIGHAPRRPISGAAVSRRWCSATGSPSSPPARVSTSTSLLEEDRLYGSDWYRFLSGCRGVLGTESGVSCSDLEDEVREEYEELAARGENPTIERLEQGSLGKRDWAVPLRTTSARHFEAAAFRVCQVMFEGRYSAISSRWSTTSLCARTSRTSTRSSRAFETRRFSRELTENAHRDLIASGAHSFESFVGGFDETLRSAGLVPPAHRTQGEVGRRSLRLCSSPRRVVARYAAHWWDWLRLNYPGLWRTIHWATRPVVIPIRKPPAILRREAEAAAASERSRPRYHSQEPADPRAGRSGG